MLQHATPFVYTAEVDDTVRELSLAGYQYDGVQDTNNSSVNGSRNSLFYWVAGATEPTWMYSTVRVLQRTKDLSVSVSWLTQSTHLIPPQTKAS